MVLYNLTKVAESNTTLQFMQNTDTVFLNGLMGILILIMVFGIMFINMLSNNVNPKKALVGVLFVNMVLAFLLRIMELIDDTTVFVCIILAAGALALTAWQNR